ncbi:MAG: hypothetical protein M1837_001796 [Sclerophora amabilis]|nr:MAG: hypothetical protein M1837_001796 [Sclerophora amabilis]
MESVAKEFRYLTKPSMTRPMHLKDTRLLSSTIIHLLLGPLDAIDQIQELLCLRQAAAITERPVLIWEPAPLSCLPENLDVCLQAAKLVDIFSPNHLELASFFGVETPQRFDRNIFKDLASKCLANGIGPHNSGTVVVRAGEEGCCIYSRRQKHMVWLPAYYGRSDAALSAPSGKIVDPTGCGNAFLGAYAVGLLETQDDTQAAYYGTVASSFALEQIGPPKKRIHPDGEELWNDVSVSSRLEEFIARVDCGVTMLEP